MRGEKEIDHMSNDKGQEKMKPYKPEHPADKETIQHEQQEIREAAKHAAQEIAGEELGDQDPGTRKQAEKEIHQAAERVQKEKKQS